MTDTLEKLKEQHFENYKKAISEIVKNNSIALFDEDIMSLLKKPPLDSMDLIKIKFLDLAKKNSIILKTLELDNIIESYRSDVILVCDSLKDYRIKILLQKLNNNLDSKYDGVIKCNKKDFNEINKANKKTLKEKMTSSFDKKIVNNVNCIFTEEVDYEVKDKIISEVIKFVNKNYFKQVIDSVDFKVLVKDTILINLIKEQGERYIFTLKNSHIFN